MKADDKNFKKYKFKELKMYASDEWMAGSTKKYRTVFERMETTYMRAEFSFYNKLFDEEKWKCKITYKCFSIKDKERKELCSYDVEKEVNLDENIVYIRDGWGNAEPGSYWLRGDYDWEAWIDGELVATTRFYIEDVGMVRAGENPYFDIGHVKLYEGDGSANDQENKKYLKKISRKTRYQWVEFALKNKTDKDYFCEVFFNWYDDAGQPKGQDVRRQYVKTNSNGELYTFHAGWGNEAGNIWKDDKYTLEIVFMDTLIAVVPFETGEEEEEGFIDPITDFDKALTATVKTSTGTGAGSTSTKQEETLEDVLKKLDELIGMEEIKKNIREHINYLNFEKIRKEKGLSDSGGIKLHAIFTGNPGTGKTTVVRLLGKIYQKMGLLTKGHVKEVDRSDLVAQYIGQTAPKVKKVIDEARGGILFIDEAYSLTRAKDDSNDFGHEVIEIILKEMSDGKGNIAIMCAGYPKQMQDFIDSNPGLKSRFGHYFHFQDYMPEELIQIAEFAAAKSNVTLTAEAKNVLSENIIEAYRKRDESFGNARFAHSVITEAKMNMGQRLMKAPNVSDLTNEQLSTVEAEDIQKVFASHGKKKLSLSVNDKLLKEGLDELNQLTGMNNIKDDVNELVKLVKFYQETGRDVLGKFSLHSVFTGNPGTGKTTVARIVAKIYKGLGLLERGHIVEVDREGLVAGYVGQTATKTAARIDEAMGGILFIDEAYALANVSTSHDFGQEAIQVILKRMEDHRGEFGVIVAGYPDNMHEFIESNPGFRSRFDRTFQFFDYSPEEMYVIALSILAKEKMRPDAQAEEHLKKYFAFLYANRDKHFGNARSVRQVIGEGIKNQNLRLASMTAAQRTKEMLETLTFDDVKEFEIKETRSAGGTLGFKYGVNA